MKKLDIRLKSCQINCSNSEVKDFPYACARLMLSESRVTIGECDRTTHHETPK